MLVYNIKIMYIYYKHIVSTYFIIIYKEEEFNNLVQRNRATVCKKYSFINIYYIIY